jgi:thiol-disulfide isomerase/thioredoxin
VGLGVSVDQYIQGDLLTAIGLLMLSIPMLFFLGRLFLADVARTSSNLNIYSVFVVLGLLILIFAFYNNESQKMSSIGFLIAICWFLYVKWYSVFPDRRNTLLAKDKILPSLKFEDANGKPVFSDSFLGKKNILLFYRGNWCPLCMAQIKELALEYKDLESKGIQTVLISPQPHTNTMKLASKYDVGFKFLVDKDN